MKREEAKLLKELLERYVKEEGLETGLLRLHIFEAWDNAVGDDFAQATSGKYYRENVLTCTISSSMLRSEIYPQKERIILKMNELLGEQLIKKIILR